MGRFICMVRTNLGTARFNGEAAIPHTFITCLTLGNVLVQVATRSSFYFLPPFLKKHTLAIQAKNERAPGPLPALRTLLSPWARSGEDEETEQQPASFVSGARATPRPPHRRGPEPAPLPARPRRPGPRLAQTARSALARGGTGATAAAAASGSHPERGREGRKTNNKTWLLVPSGNRGPAGSDEGEVVRFAGSRPALPARLPEQPERSRAEPSGAAASAPPEPQSARPLARPPARATASPPRPGQPAPPRPVRSRSRGCGSDPGLGLRCRRHDWNVGRPVGKGPSCMSPGADCTGHAAGGGQVWASDLCAASVPSFLSPCGLGVTTTAVICYRVAMPPSRLVAYNIIRL